MRADIIQTNFTSGEVSPLLRGRVDITKYFNGVEKLENFIVKPQGGITRRPGTYFVAEVKDSSKSAVLVEFEFSTIQAYVLEFGPGYIRVYKDGGIVVDGDGDPVEITTPYLEDELKMLDFAQSADVLYICHNKHMPMKLSRTNHTTWALSAIEPFDGPYLDENVEDITLTLGTVVDRAHLHGELTAVNNFDGDEGYVEYRKEGKLLIAKLISKVSASECVVEPMENRIVDLLAPEVGWESWGAATTSEAVATHAIFTRQTKNMYIRYDPETGVQNIKWGLITNYDGNNRDKITKTDVPWVLPILPWVVGPIMKDRTTTGVITASEDLFKTTDVGRHIRLNLSSKQVWGIITAYTDAKTVSIDIKSDLPFDPEVCTVLMDHGVTKQWKLGAWCSELGYPSCLVFHEERLIFANNGTQPQTIWTSVSGDYENFAPTDFDSVVLDSSAMTYTIASGLVNSIQWMESGGALLIGTTSAEWLVRATSATEPITPTNITITQQTAYGTASTIKPRRAGGAVLFVQRAGNKVRELIYDFSTDNYLAHDLNILSEHILRQGNQAADMGYQQEPSSIAWLVLGDGTLAALTYVKDQEVYSWHRHILGGDGIVESIAVIPSVDGTENSVYLLVKRVIQGSIKRYIEYFTPDFNPSSETSKDEMYFVDCGLSYSGTPQTVFSGLSHLEGKYVDIVADGALVEPQMVIDGEIELNKAATVVHVGLNYVSKMKTLPLEGGGESGTSQGRTKRIGRIVFRLLNTLGLKYGPSEDKLTEHSFRSVTQPISKSPPLFTGDVLVHVDASYDIASSYVVVQDKPYPITIIALMPEIVTS